MPINTDLNTAPYFDDFDLEKQYYRVLFKPSYAVQARELTQLQSILQNQIEQFGDNIFKEGSIIKGCNFTQLADLKFVKLTDKVDFDISQYVGGVVEEQIGGETVEVDVSYELEGQVTGLRASVIAATRGFETRAPDLNTFFINYLNTNEVDNFKIFQPGELLHINRIRRVGDQILSTRPEDEPAETISVTSFANSTGSSYGIRSSQGIIFQRGHFLFADDQIIIVSKYNSVPDDVSVGYEVKENIKTVIQDNSLYDNAVGSFNENAPGADRLELVPELTVKSTFDAETSSEFFILARYENGSVVQLRDVSQYNVIGEELARRTYEESGDYILDDFKVKALRRNTNLQASVGTGTGYVRGFRVENAGERFFNIDPISNTSVQENQPISFNYGGYVDIKQLSGTVSLDDFSTVNLQSNTSITIGTAIVKNITPDRLYLFDVEMSSNNTFNDVSTVVGSSGFIEISPSMKDVSVSEMIFDTGMFSLKDMNDISLSVRDVTTGTEVNDEIVISADTGEDFAVNNDDIVVVDATNTKLELDSVTTSVDNLTLTINVVPGQNPSSPVTVYFNKRISSADPYDKISKNVFVKVNYDSNDPSDNKINVGFPDVYEIVSITDSANTDVTNSFKLRTNQKDDFYDHSYIEYIPSRPEPADGELIVNMNVFKLVTSGSKQYFFNINSYPSGFDTNKIPAYIASSGKVYNLRDSLDFRPYADPVSNADYDANTAALAPVIDEDIDTTPTFSGTFVTPALNENGLVDYEFYLNRTDVITIDKYGKFALIKGDENAKSVPPIVDDRLVISEIFVPGFPALSPAEANTQNRPDYAVKIKPRGVKNYTMKDIQGIESKIDRLQYYVVLNTLERNTKDLVILDENGLDRFKNGIIVDPFNDLSIANMDSVDFNSAIDFTEKSLTPSVKGFPLNLKYKNNSSASIFPTVADAEIASLGTSSEVNILSQRYASSFRNCVSNFYNYKGVGNIFPQFDFAHDFVTNPVRIETDTDTQQSTDSIQEFLPLTTTSSEIVSTDVATQRNLGQISTNITDTITVLERQLQVAETRNETFVGDFVTNFSFNPFIRSRDINVYMSGLRPDTRHYFFFDEVDVNSSVIPGSVENNARNIQRNGAYGDPITSDENGIIRAVFTIPEETFFVGERKLEIVDVDQYDSIDSGSTSYGSISYNAYNISGTKTRLTQSTRIRETTVNETTTTRNVVNRRIGEDNTRGDDPLAQTFFIKQGMGRGSDTVFVSSIDLYFKRKSTLNGVTVMLREVVNGYPSYDILPFSKIHLTSSEVNTSDDASVKTKITFDAPVRLDTEKEYCVVVQPDANDPNYLIFTSKVGGADLTPGDTQGQSIVQDWGDGVLFTSTNNRAWESYQDEDLKFTLYRHDFNSSTGSVTLTNDDHDFLSIESSIGKFRQGELAYSEKSLSGGTGSTVSVVSGNNTITGTSLDDTYSVGDFILIESGSDKGLHKIANVSSSSIILTGPALFTATASHTPVVTGEVVYYNARNPRELYLENSSASSTKKFAAADIIYGIDTNAQATITSVDDIDLSYIQPMISRSTDSVSSVLGSALFTDSNDTDVTFTRPVPFNDKTSFNSRGVKIVSKSNDPSRAKPFDFVINMQNDVNPTSSPLVDLGTSSVFAYQYKITDVPTTTSKYISKTVELAENFDAEDFQLYTTAYRPVDTDVRAYIKIQNASDPVGFNTNEWIELELFEGISLYSSSTNANDFKEYGYRLPESEKNDGVVTYSNSAGAFEGYTRFAIKLEFISTSINKAPRVLDYRGIALT